MMGLVSLQETSLTPSTVRGHSQEPTVLSEGFEDRPRSDFTFAVNTDDVTLAAPPSAPLLK